MTTSQVNRQLWELDNLNRAYWNQPLLPEPEGGFAEEPPPPYAELLPVVEHWFREATTGQLHRPRRAKIPLRPEVTQIARLIYGWKTEACPSFDPQRAVAIEKGHRLQRAVADMKMKLREFLDLALPSATPGDPAVERLVDLLNAAQLAEPYVGQPHKQGPQMEAWHVMARALAPLVSAGLVSAGYQGPSLKSDGPVVKVICRALHALEGVERSRAAVASCLKRQQKRGTKI
jgi:hypothetical protein